MNAAATFLTLGHLSSATTVNAFPKMPTIIIRIVNTAAKFSNGRPNLKNRILIHHYHYAHELCGILLCTTNKVGVIINLKLNNGIMTSIYHRYKSTQNSNDYKRTPKRRFETFQNKTQTTSAFQYK